ncbi:E3 ubiquitin-protein ligase RGLG4-like isoform X1 [Salvia splendens]|uniref:E3 ubiquitin-protein ligase RGLG4-like isoform X1 n=1 Tax=Salvia splendens TaxID=180675 RepID=UPI001C26BA9E|nr:E3 ubiquitin-protein ligase RGLG4-like isoform X1 [Salvia splendens]
MGNLLFRSRKRTVSRSVSSCGPAVLRTRSRSRSISRRRSRSSSFADNPLPDRNSKETKGGMSSGSGGAEKKKKYSYIPDNFTSFDQVTLALREAGLESSNLILGIDFTKSNEWTGKVSFSNRSLHAISDTPNPYEKAISIIGKTLAPFDEDNLIPCFGFGDATTHDQEVFSFHGDHSSCHGFEEVMACYRRIVPKLRLSGPTSYGPVVDAAVDIVEKSGGQYHVLVIIADGQVTRSVNTSDNELSPQEERTINSLVNASLYPLSIILIGVGDGPWDDMKKFDDKIPDRDFDNFQFVNFTEIMSKSTSSAEKETAFALAALMEIPVQYKAAREFGLLGLTYNLTFLLIHLLSTCKLEQRRVTGKAKKIVPRPPPVPYTPAASHNSHSGLSRQFSNNSASAQDDQTQVCPVCLTNAKNIAFSCGHLTCSECSSKLSECPICRKRITSRLRLYS